MGVGDRRRDRLFAEHVLAGRQASDRDICMARMRRRDHDRFHLGSAEQGIEVGIYPAAVLLDDRLAGPGCARLNARQLEFGRAGDRGKIARASNVSAADDGYPNFRHRTFPLILLHVLDRSSDTLFRRFNPGVEDRHRREVDRIVERRVKRIAGFQMVKEFLPDCGAPLGQRVALLDEARRFRPAVAMRPGSPVQNPSTTIVPFVPKRIGP